MEAYVTRLYEKLKSEIWKYNPQYDKDFIERAFLYAYKAHARTFRKSRELYITHPLHTAINLTKIEADDISLVSALLHEILDNNNYKLKDICNEFWEEVANIVDGINKLWNLYYTVDMNKKDIENLKKSLVLAGNDIRVFLVKIADRYHNLETLDFLPKQKRYRIAKETQEIYLPIVNFLSIWEFLTQMHDLCFKYTAEDEYKKLDVLFWKKYEEHKNKIISAHNHIIEEFNKSWLIVVNIEGRVKSLYSIYKKMKIKNFDANEIYDVLALRVITKTLKDAYIALWIIHKLYKVKSDRFKDYISDPKANGYQSIHTTVFDTDWEFLEFQIQTQEMAKLNKLWIAAHFLYKWFWVEYKNFPEWMKWFLEHQKNSLDQKLFLEKLKDEVIISEIKCFDINGKFILLPKNSVLIDYAFQISAEEWNYFSWAFINWVATQNPFYVLKNEDIIKLEKSSKIYTQYKIENYFLLKTQKAKDGVKMIFEKYSKNKLIDLWKYMINSNLETYSYRHFHANSIKMRNTIIKSFWLKNENQLYLFLAIWSVDSDMVVKRIISLNDKKTFDKKVTLKMNLKLKDFNTINYTTKIFYNLNLEIKDISYKENKNCILLTFDIDSNSTLSELLSELKRAPNIAKITRIFPLRLTIYYLIYFISISVISSIIFFMNLFDFTKYEKTMVLQWVLFITSILMVCIVFFIKYVVKTILPDILRYKRFWLSLFWLNTYVFFIIFWEATTLWFSKYFILYFFLCFFIYIITFYEFLHYRKYKN